MKFPEPSRRNRIPTVRVEFCSSERGTDQGCYEREASVLRRLLLAMIVVGLILAIHRSVVSAHRIKVHDVCGIPAWNYTPATLTPAQVGTAFPVIAASATTGAAGPAPAVPNPPTTTNLPTVAPTTPVMRSYQLQSDLTFQQCAIRHVVVTLEPAKAGLKTTVSYLGVQNPALADSKLQAMISTIKRNCFHVRVLALSSATPQPAAAADPSQKVGSTVLFTLETEPQWFERGETRFVQLQCPPRLELSPYFDLIDRIEIEFRYE